MLFTRVLRTMSAPGQVSGQTVNGPAGGGRSRGTVRMAALTGVSALSLIAGVGAASAAGAGLSAAPADVDQPPVPGDWSCDDKTADPWFPGKVAPDNPTYNPSAKHTRTQLYQYHVRAEDTFAEASTRRRGSYIYVEDKKSGQKCPSPRNPAPDGYFATMKTSTNGFLDNRNTSVRTCIVEPQMHGSKCGAWYREDSGGHRQLDFDGLEKLDREIDPGANASYDDHATATGGSIADGHGIFFGPHEVARLRVDPDSPGLAYGTVATPNKNVEVRIDSDKYGKGDWAKPTERTSGGLRLGTTGVLYNDDDRLRVVVREPNGDVHKGAWRSGRRVD